jgi:hypothetical protein
MNAATLFLGFLWFLFGRDRGMGWPETSPPSGGVAPRPRPELPPAPAPWPQVVPPGLPPFPGSGWEYDEPPPAAVKQRAQQLVSQLWARGSGAFKIEQTAGRWIAYRAEVVASGKQGVVAFRIKRAAAPAAPRPAAPAPAPRARPASQPAPRAPVPNPRATPRAPAPAAPAPAPPAPAQQYRVRVGPAVIQPAVTPTSTVALPMLRYGDGLKPKAPNPDVRLLQQKLGIAADGQFGPGTGIAVQTFQRNRGLDPDGIVGPKTWAALFASNP